MRRIIIAGSRAFDDYRLLFNSVIEIAPQIRQQICGQSAVEIVSGGAKGADFLGEIFAKDMGLPIKIFKADWDKYGKSAGYKRNEEMAQYADELIAFWDGESKGTKHMIDLANKYKLKVSVVRFESSQSTN
jgi:hypothetical protein